jgi:hypothetical protein
LSQRAEMLSVENFITLMKDYEKQNWSKYRGNLPS